MKLIYIKVLLANFNMYIALIQNYHVLIYFKEIDKYSQ
jgi:hypothetical protein